LLKLSASHAAKADNHLTDGILFPIDRFRKETMGRRPMDQTVACSRGPERDLRIDFFRGLALYMIIFNHIPGDPLSKFTYIHLGFSDAAEIFVFLSGVSCGIAYSRLLSRHGVGGLLRSVSWRALQIYTYYLITSLVTILAIAVSQDVIAIPENHQGFITLRESPLAAIKSAILFNAPPELPSILILYLELTLFAIPMFLLIAARSSVAALLTSGGLWLLVQFHPDLLPRLSDPSYFNPIAWQFIFCIGMFVGTRYSSDTSLVEPFRKPPWVLLACTIVGAALLYRIASKNETDWIFQMKENLSAIPLVHFLSVAFLVAIFVRPTSPILHWPGASAIIKTGRCSLQVFCVGAVLSVLLNLFIAVEAPPAWERLILDCLAILLIAAMATALMSFRRTSQSAPIPPSAVRITTHGTGQVRQSNRITPRF
jgi:hypothetical protein